MADLGLVYWGFLASGRPDTRNTPVAQPSACSPVRPTRPCTFTDLRPNSQWSAPPSAISSACQRPKRIGRKRQRSSAPTSAMGPMSGDYLPRAPSGGPHSWTRPAGKTDRQKTVTLRCPYLCDGFHVGWLSPTHSLLLPPLMDVHLSRHARPAIYSPRPARLVVACPVLLLARAMLRACVCSPYCTLLTLARPVGTACAS
jgi:hypothetical protein